MSATFMIVTPFEKSHQAIFMTMISVAWIGGRSSVIMLRTTPAGSLGCFKEPIQLSVDLTKLIGDVLGCEG
jgi:hypothetical protein